MKKLFVLMSLIIIVPANAALMNNQTIANACVYTNLGVYDGTVNMIPTYTVNSYTCDAGYYLPADAVTCAACPRNGESCAGGTYTYNPDINQGIGGTGLYNCDIGYYLPAGAISCVLCPTNKYCSGGTYTYNPDIDQGQRLRLSVMNDLTINDGCNYDNLGVFSGTTNMIPIYAPKSYTCNAGYYLPADGVVCVACLPGAVCAGGTYTYNPTTDQGMVCNGAMYLGRCHELCSVGKALLHAGEHTYPVFADKTNVPSPIIHIRRDANTVCYVYMEPDVEGEHGLKLRFTDGNVYRAIDPR